jgi:hypothetical protein
MHTRLARRLSVATLLVAGTTLAGAGAAQAATASATVGTWHGHHHWHENCNNDPDSEMAMDPDVCPPSHNWGAHYEEHAYPGDYYGYGYGHPRY